MFKQIALLADECPPGGEGPPPTPPLPVSNWGCYEPRSTCKPRAETLHEEWGRKQYAILFT